MKFWTVWSGWTRHIRRLPRVRRQRNQPGADWLDSSPNPLIVIRPDGGIHYINPAAQHLLGYGGTSLLGASLQRILPSTGEGDIPLLQMLFSHRSQRPDGCMGLRQMICHDGRSIMMLIDAVALPDNLVMLVPRQPSQLYPDLSQHYLANRLLKSTNLGEVGIGTWILHMDSGELVWSEEMHQLFGTHPASFPATLEAYYECIHPEDRDDVRFALEQHTHGNQPFDLEYRVVRGDGSIRYMLERNHIHRRPNGSIDHLWGTVADMTVFRELQEQLSLSQLVVEYCSEGVAIMNESFDWTFVNPALCDMTGLSREMLQRSPPIFLHPQTHQPLQLAEMLPMLISHGGFWQGELGIARADGYLPVLASLSVAHSNPGLEGKYYIWTCTDITPIKVYERQLTEMAFYDSLTGLANRTLLNDRLQQALHHARRKRKDWHWRSSTSTALKTSMTVSAMPLGDALLKEVALRLKDAVRDCDTVGRWGGDEFAILLPDCRGREDALTLVQRLLSSCRLTRAHVRGDMQVSASIGVVHYPEHGADPSGLIQQADQAMYNAKQYGQGVVWIYGETQPAYVQEQRCARANRRADAPPQR
ncbi:diguanylate cyclase domain-containing protein [Paludibacterium denitrificans]|uniref:diguanylate cyclase domain-containing protein n=1 Tax=Paludibacterium denitrificans TaxID=2675226 RepID=UPI001E656377|nr:diguanylate cyclase [Paludibacterium denitrificans]